MGRVARRRRGAVARGGGGGGDKRRPDVIGSALPDDADPIQMQTAH